MTDTQADRIVRAIREGTFVITVMLACVVIMIFFVLLKGLA